MSALGEISQPVCWEYISRNRQSPTRACHLPQGCRTLIFSLRVSPDDEIVLPANTKCDSIPRASQQESRCLFWSIPIPPHPPRQHLTDITTLPRRPQWVSNYGVTDVTMSKCALGKRNFAKTVIQVS